MVKRFNEQNTSTDKGKIRVLYAEVEGNNQSLQDLMKTIAAAMNRHESSRTQTNRIPTTDTNEARTLSGGDESPPQDQMDEAEANGDAEEDQSAQSSQRKQRGKGVKVDRNAGIQAVPDLDFVPDNKLSLKQFYAGKNPKNDMENTLVIGYYLQHTMGLQAFGPGHILSGFKHIAKPVPVDLPQTIRNVKNKKVWFNFDKIENVHVTTEGENYVEHELGMSTSEDEAE